MADRDDDWRNTRSPEEAAADTREPERAARIRAEDDEDTRRRQDETAANLRAAAEALEDNREGLRETRGALRESERDLRRTGELARDVAEGAADQGIVCCWTGTGASIAANKVPGVRAALCGDAETARGARRWNDANVLALSLRSTSQPVLEEILDAWFAGEPSVDASDAANVRHLDEI